MEEASVAGESPDRSKQRESSAVPTSGSTGPVPESAPEPPSTPDAPERRDPRLAMTRDNPAPTATTSRGGVDTATRVLSRHELAAVRARLAEAENAGEEDRATEDADAGRGSAEDAESADASAGDAGDAEDAGAAAGNGGDAKADGADVVAGDAEDAGAAAGNGGDAKADGADAVESESSQGAESRGTEAAAPGDDRLRAAVAAWVASGDAEGDKEGDKETPGADEGAKPAETRDEADGAEAAAAEGAEKTEDADSGTGEDVDGKAPRTAPRTDSSAEAGADAAEDTIADDTPASVTASDDASANESHDEPQDDPDDTPAAADGEDAPQGPPAPGDESSTGGAGGNTSDEGEAEAAVDQPTTVFKAVRPTKPSVDHPTTMLKSPKPKAEAKPEAKPESKPESESPSERTSKFVALKPDIRQHPPKTPATPNPPAAPPEATAAIPQVGPERTTQQPLPPKPPLDLLAELTNTPPPPDTPVRTLVRRIKIWTPLVLLLAILFAIAQAVRPLPAPTLALTAEESYTFDGGKAALPWPGEGQGWMDVNGIGTMGDFGEQTPVAIGSVAKAMTAYVVLKDHALKPGEDGEKIKVDALAEKEGGYDQDGESTLNTVKEGETITLRDAIAAIMIPSANNIARLLARWDAGTEKAFIEKMNTTAKELGMTNTTYTDASGLKETTVSTAEDQVKLGHELVRMPELMKITSMGQWFDPSGKKHYNYNYLVPYNGAIGIKTGTTSAAGGNLLFAARKEVGGETVTLVGAILGQHKSPIIQTVNDVSKTAMLAAQDALTSAKILKKGDVVGYVDDGLGGRTPVVLTQDVTAVGWSGLKVKLSFAADDVPHTAKAGTKVGTLTVGDGTSGAVRVPVALQTDLAEPGFTDKLTRVG
ncbi:serine hydrolase [Streptomyces sp. NPDC051243]|uniref:serine hydrolase n=1 Tax=Streptomyces sp. NPDC051243 TaxID=3365646 RepID=UPI0037939463